MHTAEKTATLSATRGMHAKNGAATTPSASSNTNGNGNGNGGNHSNGTSKGKKKRANEKKAKEDGGKAGVAAPPGFAKPQGKTGAAPAVGFSEAHERMLRHRALFAFRFLVGKMVDVELVDATRYAGVLDCIDPEDFSIVLKNTVSKGETQAEFKNGTTMVIKRPQLAQLSVHGLVDYAEAGLGPGAAGGFRTDTEISGKSHAHLFGRELETAQSWLDPSLDTGDLEDERRRGKTQWNQFEVNEKLFGVVSTFDENLYTTKLDKTKISSAQSREAERIAREIERQSTNNFHLQEERGQSVQRRDLDEEALYSSVDRRQEAASLPGRRSNAYIPPALRGSQRPTNGTTAKPASEASGATPAASATTTPAPSKKFPTASADSTSAPATSSKPSEAEPEKKIADAKRTQPGKTAAPATGSPQSPKADGKDTPNAPSPAAPAGSPPAADTASKKQRRAPISFSEAVTGRPAATKTPAPQSSTLEAAEPKKHAQPAKAPTTASSNATPVNAKAESADTKTGKKHSPHAKKQSSPSKSTPASASKKSEESEHAKSTTASSTPAKKGLNPNAKEFKLSATAAEFTPKFMTQAMPVSPYRQGVPYGGMSPPQPMAGGMGYGGMPEEWMYEGVMMEDGEYGPPAMMGYGMPMMSVPPMMQYPMVPQQGMPVMGGGQRGNGRYQGYMPPPRGYYAQTGVPGAPMYSGNPGEVIGSQNPPLPIGPTLAPENNSEDDGNGATATDAATEDPSSLQAPSSDGNLDASRQQ